MSTGPSADLEATSILTLGSKGTLDGVPFELVGRRCISGHRGAIWNEWTLRGVAATLAESAGRFTLYREGPLVTADELVVGERLPWTVVERGTATTLAQWGDVSPAPASWSYADLSSCDATGRRATVSDGHAFLGTTIDPTSLGLTIRREPPRLLKMPNVSMPAGIELWLDVGDKGTLAGVAYHVLGVVARSTVGSEPSRWQEYLLYAAGVGLRWLVVLDGSWSFVSPVEAGSVTAEIDRATMQLVRVDWVSGELSWAAEIGETVMAFEVGDLVREHTPDDVTWSRTLDVATDDVARAFQKRAMPLPR